jgi:glyoxylase-like metal-dependent hydrolase (beta-lactamase superfamily II)
MKGMKAYVLDLGCAKADSNWFEAYSTVANIFDENPPRKWTTTPFYAVLIEHPTAGWILFDTGAIAAKEWPQNLLDVVKVFNDGENTLEKQLAKAGVKPKDIKHVILSHFHIDHIGGLELLKDTATFYIQRKEAEAAYTTVMATPDVSTYGFYYKPAVLATTKSTVYLDGDTELFPGIHLMDVRGHTAGLMAMVMELESGNVLVTSDAANMKSNYYGHPLGIIYDSIGAGASTKKLHEIEKKFNCKEVWFSHDEAQFASMKKAPKNY